MPKKTLYDISQELQILDEMLEKKERLLEESNGEVTEEIEAFNCELNVFMNSVFEGLSEKIDGYCDYIRSQKNNAEVCNREKQRYTKLERLYSKRADFLEYRLKEFMQNRGMNDLSTVKNTVKLVGNGGKTPLNIVDESLIPDEYKQVKQEVNWDLVRELLEQGETIPGVEFKERGVRLKIG